MYYRSDFATTPILQFILACVIVIPYIFGCITLYIDITHSIKKRVIRGEEYSAGNVFGWILGWTLAMYYSLGLATIIYFLAKRREIQATKQMHSQTLANIRAFNAQQYQSQYYSDPYRRP